MKNDYDYGPETFRNVSTGELRDFVTDGPTGAADLAEMALHTAARTELAARDAE